MRNGCQPHQRCRRRPGHKLTCTIVDSRGDPADAVPAAQQMLATGDVYRGHRGPGQRLPDRDGASVQHRTHPRSFDRW